MDDYTRALDAIDANRPKRPNPGPYAIATTADAWQAASQAGRSELESIYAVSTTMGTVGDYIVFEDGSHVVADGWRA